MTKTIPKKKKCRKAKWLYEKALHTAVERREVKGKGERERYTQLNAKIQRIPRRDKKGFLSKQCKEIEENNRMAKTRDLFKKIRDTKGTFHVRMGMKTDRNVKDLTEKRIRRGCKKTQKNSTRKVLMTQITMIVWHSPRVKNPAA